MLCRSDEFDHTKFMLGSIIIETDDFESNAA